MQLHDTRKELPPVETEVIGYWLYHPGDGHDPVVSNVCNSEMKMDENGTWWEQDDEWGWEKLRFVPDAWQHYATREDVLALLEGE